MKLLGWMHRKLRQNAAGDTFKDFTNGNPCNLVDHHSQLHHHTKQLKLPLHPISDQWFYEQDVSAADPEEEDYTLTIKESDLFHGLLAIGTLGLGATEDTTTGTATPTFGIPPPQPSVDSITEKEENSEATEFDLMVINSELEKVLVIPEADRVSSARASQVSLKQLVVSGYPLQEYLLGSSIEMAETISTEQEQHRQHKHVSLGELFMKSKIMEEGGGKKKGEKSTEKQAAVVVQQIMKKMLKRRGSSRFSAMGTSGGGGEEIDHGTESNSETKLHKIIQKFHRKVHPENSVAAKKDAKASNSMIKSHVQFQIGGGGDRGVTAAPRSKSLRKESSSSCLSCCSILPATTSPITTTASSDCDSNGNREQWIKTDADYLVLEL